MLNKLQKRAVDLMYDKPEDEVIEELGVSMKTLAKWRENPEFQSAIICKGKAIRDAASRLAVKSALCAAKNLQRAVGDPKEAKLSLDVLKAADLFTQAEIDDRAVVELLLSESLREGDE